MENKLTPKQALEEIGKLKVCFDGIVVEINGCTKTREKYDLINQALTEHEKQKQILDLLRTFMQVEKQPYDKYESITLQLTVVDFSVFKEEFKIIKEWLK